MKYACDPDVVAETIARKKIEDHDPRTCGCVSPFLVPRWPALEYPEVGPPTDIDRQMVERDQRLQFVVLPFVVS